MTHGSLFSGLGGFDLAARWVPQVVYEIFRAIETAEESYRQ